jgi:hypothetical protein
MSEGHYLAYLNQTHLGHYFIWATYGIATQWSILDEIDGLDSSCLDREAYNTYISGYRDNLDCNTGIQIFMVIFPTPSPYYCFSDVRLGGHGICLDIPATSSSEFAIGDADPITELTEIDCREYRRRRGKTKAAQVCQYVHCQPDMVRKSLLRVVSDRSDRSDVDTSTSAQLLLRQIRKTLASNEGEMVTFREQIFPQPSSSAPTPSPTTQAFRLPSTFFSNTKRELLSRLRHVRPCSWSPPVNAAAFRRGLTGISRTSSYGNLCIASTSQERREANVVSGPRIAASSLGDYATRYR